MSAEAAPLLTAKLPMLINSASPSTSGKLTFRFPEVHEDAGCSIVFQRTLRIPDDEKEYPLPPGLRVHH